MDARRWFLLVSLMVGSACAGPPEPPARRPEPISSAPSALRPKPRAPTLAEQRVPPGKGSEPDGADDGRSGLALAALDDAARARFVEIPAPPTAHPLVCDALAVDGALLVSHAVRPIDRNGARIHRFDPTATGEERWRLVFDWDRGGHPNSAWARGGEGFTALRSIDDRVWVPDADSPGPEAFGATDAFVENLVIRSRPGGTFPPPTVVPEGAMIQPWAFHAFDVARFAGGVVVSGGAVSPDPRGTPYPAALWFGPTDGALLDRRLEFARGHGVVRTTRLHRHGGRLYAGFQNNQRRIRADVAVLNDHPDRGGRPVVGRLTPEGGYLTRGFASHGGRLYWLGERPSRLPPASALLVSDDGVRFRPVALPEDAGAPQDLIVSDGGTAYLLTRRGVLRRRGVSAPFTWWLRAPPGDPFGRYDPFCNARLAAVGGRLFATTTRDGSLLEITPLP